MAKQIVEWTKGKKDDIVWEFPDDRLRWGAALIVRENQWGVFFRDGKSYDAFQAGRFMLSTADVPLLGKVLKAVAGDIFQASVIFVSRSQFDGKFGGRSQTQELAPLLFNGQYWFKVEDPKIFVNEICGNQSAMTTQAVNDYLRGYFNENLITELSKFTLRDVYGKLEETSLAVKVGLRKAFSRIGLELVDLKFNKIDTDEKFRERLFFMQTGGVSAQNVLVSETQKDVAASLGKSPGTGTAFVMGGGMNVGGAASGYVQGNVRNCPKCGAQNPSDNKVCQNCGTKFPDPDESQSKGPKFCPECGAETKGAKFCPECGKKLT
jgi:membrane protease subunit (stomatin/prohibitin family)